MPNQQYFFVLFFELRFDTPRIRHRFRMFGSFLTPTAETLIQTACGGLAMVSRRGGRSASGGLHFPSSPGA